MRRVTSETRSGLSLFEVMFLLALLAIATAVILMRVSKGRSASRRIECESNLRSLSIALDSYQLRYGQYPIGTQNPTSPILSEAKGYHHNWIEGLLPQMEQQSLFEAIDERFGVYASENETVGRTPIEILHCPSAGNNSTGPHQRPNRTDYAGVTASTESPISESGDGTFVLNRVIRPSDLTDGLNYVAILGEKLPAASSSASGSPAPAHPDQNAATDTTGTNTVVQWNSGTRASLRTLGHHINSIGSLHGNTKDTDGKTHAKESELFVGGFASRHPGGAYFLMASGEFRFCTEQTDRRILEQLGNRSNDSSSP